VSGPGTLELWLVRHGETAASRGRRLAGWTNVSLTEEGERQALALREHLAGASFTSVWCSDLDRARRTAALAWGGEVACDARLREMSFGSLEGRDWDTLDAAVQQAMVRFVDFAPPGGETFDALRGRVLAFVGSLAPGRHLLFTHGGVVRLLSREVGEDCFVPTGTLLVIDWSARRLLSRIDGPGEASRGLPASGGAQGRLDAKA
jgi:probable phosphoglycerate mutase